MNNKKYEFIYKSHLRYISIIIFFYTVCTFFVVSCFNSTIQNFHKNNPGWMMILAILWFLLPVVLLNTVFSKVWILPLINVAGLLISCAMPAAITPKVAMRSAWTSCSALCFARVSISCAKRDTFCFS